MRIRFRGYHQSSKQWREACAAAFRCNAIAAYHRLVAQERPRAWLVEQLPMELHADARTAPISLLHYVVAWHMYSKDFSA